MYNIGLCYSKGNGVIQVFDQSILWFRKAADKGHARAAKRVQNKK